jgi:tetratricopeptide (TPR) repeat protein
MVLLGLSGGVWWYNRPPVQHDPVQVVIADIENRTNDPTFNRILEPMLKRALEGASFITAYDRDYMRRTLGVQPPEELNEDAARSVAVQQGLGVVLAGFLEPQGRGYRVSVRASQAVTGDVITTEQDIAGNKDAVLETATRLMTRVRNALGDEASESAQMFAMMTMTTTSLDVVRLYADAMAATSTGKFEDARQALLKAIELDPKFGLAYSSLAGVSRNLGRLQDADKYINEALRYLDGMTERERFNTRGTYARLSGDYQQCVEQFGELITRFAADAIAYNQRALCLSKLRQMREAVEDMRKAVQILPKRVVLRDNLALYANYGGDFLTGEQEARGVEEPDVFTVMALAFAQLGQGLPREAESTYKQLESMGVLGASLAASGYGDVALYDGRFADAVRIFQEGAAADLKADLPDRAAAKFTWLAHAEMSRRREAAAAAAADEALKHSNAANIRFLAGRIYVGVGDAAKARRIIATLAKEPLAEPRAYGKIVEGELALKNRDPQGAIQMLREANELFDTWIGRFVLGQAYLAEGSRNSLLQADSEFDTCLNKRRGEALSLFLDEEPTYGYLPAVYYYQGRARDGIGTEGFRDSYRQYLAIRGSSTDDPLGADVRKRIASTKP